MPHAKKTADHFKLKLKQANQEKSKQAKTIASLRSRLLTQNVRVGYQKLCRRLDKQKFQQRVKELKREKAAFKKAMLKAEEDLRKVMPMPMPQLVHIQPPANFAVVESDSDSD
eukprot:2092526-Pyramimonas_sp.AAC.1